jgi:hypothetical protein
MEGISIVDEDAQATSSGGTTFYLPSSDGDATGGAYGCLYDVSTMTTNNTLVIKAQGKVESAGSWLTLDSTTLTDVQTLTLFDFDGRLFVSPYGVRFTVAACTTNTSVASVPWLVYKASA